MTGYRYEIENAATSGEVITSLVNVAQVMLVDDDVSAVGTANFDNRSFRLNFEVTGVVADKEFAGELERMLLNDLSDSKELTDYSLEEESLWERFKARGCALLAPVL